MTKTISPFTLGRDLTAGLVVYLIALPLCLGIALASNAPLFSGIVSGIVGGILIGFLSGSHTSVAGPAAGLTAVVIVQLETLGSFQAFLLALAIGGVLQIGLGVAKAGSLARFFPTSVIKGLLAAIGIILILKQIPHLVGHDSDPEGEMSFIQPDQQNTFSELFRTMGDLHPGAAAIGIASLLILVFWDRIKPLKKSVIPAPLVVVIFGVAASLYLRGIGGRWLMGANHLVQVPVAEDFTDFLGFIETADFSQWSNPAIYVAAVTIALVASLETLLNLEAVDNIDPKGRHSPASRELVAQGVGNVACGFLGGLPCTSVIVRSSVNVGMNAETKLSTMFHGSLLLLSVMLFPQWINLIPLSCLAAILLVTGFKLASPKVMKSMWAEGPYQFGPFAVTVVAIVLTDLLIGVAIGLAVAIGFILNSNFRRPLRKIMERHVGGDVTHIELADQVSFLNRAALSKEFDSTPAGGHILIDARTTDYIDPDVLNLIHDFAEREGPGRNVEVSLVGFQDRYKLKDRTQYVDYSTRELQNAITPAEVLQLLKDGHERFLTGKRIKRDLVRQVNATAGAQHPIAVIVSCIDSRTPAELIFDLGMGDIFSVRIAGNIVGGRVLGSAEYGCAVAGAKLILVLGHTRCGAVTSAVQLKAANANAVEATGCQNIDHVLRDIHESIEEGSLSHFGSLTREEQEEFIDKVARRNVQRTVQCLRTHSSTLDRLAAEGRIAIVGALYDVKTGDMTFLPETTSECIPAELLQR